MGCMLPCAEGPVLGSCWLARWQVVLLVALPDELVLVGELLAMPWFEWLQTSLG